MKKPTRLLIAACLPLAAVAQSKHTVAQIHELVSAGTPPALQEISSTTEKMVFDSCKLTLQATKKSAEKNGWLVEVLADTSQRYAYRIWADASSASSQSCDAKNGSHEFKVFLIQ